MQEIFYSIFNFFQKNIYIFLGNNYLGAATPINFDERITMDALMGKYFSDDKLVGEYRRTPIRKTDAFDYSKCDF